MLTGNAQELANAFLLRLEREPAVWVEISSTQGSVPREQGTWMAVFDNALVGTIGGGHLEFEAIERSRALLAGQAAGDMSEHQRFPLGPGLGQCCGGVVYLRFEKVGAADKARLARQISSAYAARLAPVALFGGGHVGHALARVLAPLPFALTWIDSREDVFATEPTARAVHEYSDPPQSAVMALTPGSHVLIMSFSHAEDLNILVCCLQRQRDKGDLPFIGMIGSRTKWATFRHRLEARGFSADELAHVTCPIGLTGIAGKEPEVIAVSVAAQLLQRSHALQYAGD